jgi:hypothetical protein
MRSQTGQRIGGLAGQRGHGAYRHRYAPLARTGNRGSMDVQAGR